MAIAEPAPAEAPTSDTTSEAVRPRWRVIAIRVWAGLLTVLALFMAPGIVLIGSAAPDERFMYATSTVWKLLSLGAVAVVMWTAGRSVAAYWAVGVGQLTWLIADVITPQPDGNGLILNLVNLLIFYGPLVLLRPRRRDLLHPRFQPDRVLLALALAGALPLSLYAVNVHSELSGELGFDMVGLYLSLATIGLLAALRPRGATWLPPVLGGAAVLVGLAALARPDDLASPGVGGSLLLLVWGAAFLVRAWPWSAPLRSDSPPAERHSY